MKKSLIILIIVFCIRALVSCYDCLETTYSSYTISSIETFHIDNAGENPKFVSFGVIPKEAYGIQIIKSIEQVAFQSKTLSGFPSTYAISWECPPEFQYLARDSIIDIKIITLTDFDNSHLSNSDISDYFSVFKNSGYMPTSEYLPISEYLLRTSTTFLEPIDKDILEIYLLTAPDRSGEHQFRIEIELSNGLVLSSTTSIITLE
jgi:hypothetical protein